jgi:hypothetical protein
MNQLKRSAMHSKEKDYEANEIHQHAEVHPRLTVRLGVCARGGCGWAGS